MILSHILVQHQFEADDILRALNGKQKTFPELARKFSQCGSARDGGRLGDFSNSPEGQRLWNRLDESFREAASFLKPGEISGPVRTRFGYHLIWREA